MTPSPASSPAIEVAGLQCGYEGTIILERIDFQVQSGEMFFVIGGSGCGKSTLLRNLVGLNQPMEGTVRFFGQPFSEAALAERRKQLRSFGMLFQGGALWSSLTLRQNVALPLEEHTDLSREEIAEIATLKLRQVDLAGYEDHYPAEISGGMNKRAALARALALDPAIVFFDEPWSGLDPVTSRKLDRLIRQVRDSLGTTMVIVSHELASIFGLAERAIMLDRGARGIIADGPPLELARSSPDERVREFLHRGEDSL